MGALTLKSFPFELRGWEIEKLESIDPTDGFGSDTKVYLNKDQVIQIEPDYNNNSYSTWLTDKGRQFFDGIFGIWNLNSKIKKNNFKKESSWLNLVQTLIQTLYITEHCRTLPNKNKFLTIIFENTSIEILGLLNVLSDNQSFLKIRRAENFKIDNDIESKFQLNTASNKIKLSKSTLCLLVSNNPRYEGSFLNLTLRQRFLKGDLKCFVVGSLIDLTFPVSFLGNNLRVLKNIAEGNNLICQNFKSSKNPTLIFNYELLKRSDGKNSLQMLHVLKYANVFSCSWNGLNVLSPSLSEVGTQSLNKFLPLHKNDLDNFNALYFLNVHSSNIHNLKKIAELKLLKSSFILNNSVNLFIDQNSSINNNIDFCNKLKNESTTKNFQKYLYVPSSMFYENEETFVNTEGFIKRTNKLIFKKKTKNNWQVLRKIFKHIRTNFRFLNNKNNDSIIFNSKKITNFKNYINFQYQATQILTGINFYLSLKNESFVLINTSHLKPKCIKLQSTKLKYWLDDFFNGGKDGYSHNSLILSNCSKILRSKSTNFF
jgi:NADH dehydrogenase/NADH:ubiquinone oxidoreductase subunit G